MKCECCWGELGDFNPEVIYNQWLKLMNHFEHEYYEEEITQATYELMIDALMAIKPRERYKAEELAEE